MSDDEWRALFDGATLDGWFATGDPDGWTAGDGELVCRGRDPLGRTTYLVTQERFDDFDLAFEYCLAEDANSGLYFRWSELTDRATGMELQLIDTTRYDDLTTAANGALYDMRAPTADPARPAGEWNRVRFSCRGPRIEARINGERVLDVDIREWDVPGENPDGSDNKFTDYAMADLPRRGRFGLQDHGGRARFRDLRIRER